MLSQKIVWLVQYLTEWIGASCISFSPGGSNRALTVLREKLLRNGVSPFYFRFRHPSARSHKFFALAYVEAGPPPHDKAAIPVAVIGQ